MSRYICQGTTRDGNGRVIISATVSVYLAGTSTAASIYTASSGGTAVNSVTSSSTNGSFTFYVDGADYARTQLFDITVSKSGYETKTWSNVGIYRAYPPYRNIVDYGAVDGAELGDQPPWGSASGGHGP